MENTKLFIGIDISKASFCASLLDAASPSQAHSHTFSNNEKGYDKLIHWLEKLCPQGLTHSLFVLEHTGLYSVNICLYFAQSKLTYTLVSGLQLKRSLGIRRGKSDKADAKDIALYALRHRQSLPITILPEEKLLRLQQLLSERDVLVKAHKMLSTSQKEREETGGKGSGNPVVKAQAEGLKKATQEVEKQIKDLIASCVTMQKLYDLLKSVPGIGPVTATYLLLHTRLFSRFKDSRQFASYAGIAPFEYSSGTSIRGRTKVSPLGNKLLKSLLSMAALSAIKADKELKSYYERKKAEGKHAMLVLNAVRNKVLARAFAVVKRGTPYVALAQHLT